MKKESKSQMAARLRAGKERRERAAEGAEEELPMREFGMVAIDSITGCCPNIRSYRGTDITPAIDPRLPELAESIKKHGVIEPIVVQQNGDDDPDYPDEAEYCLVAGFRRLAASRLAGRDTVPACIYKGWLSDKQVVEIQISENIHRSDLRPTEEAAIYAQMAESMGRTREQIAERVGKSVKHVSRYMKLLTLPEEVRGKIDSGEMSLAKAGTLLSLTKANIESFFENHYDYLLNLNYTAKEFETEVHRRFFRELSGKIGFDVGVNYSRRNPSTHVHEDYPPCASCPHRGQLELFEEYVTDTICPNAECFDGKKRIAEEKRWKEKERAEKKRAKEIERARAAGEEVEETAAERKARLREESYDAQRAKWDAEREERDRKESEETFAAADPLVAKKFEIGFSGPDYFAATNEDALEMYGDAHNGKLNELYKKYVGKDLAELKSSGSIEEVFKAVTIYHIYYSVNAEDEKEIKVWLGLEAPDPDEDEDEDGGDSEYVTEDDALDMEDE
ncbi:chromosome partitioning protein [Fibrobacteres bacterium R8-0-B4]